MQHDHRGRAPRSGARAQRGAALPWVFFGFLAVAGFFLFTEHRAHLMGALPFLLLALCPLMHFFHGGHGGHGRGGGPGHGGHGSPADADSRQPSPPAKPPSPHQH
jgi:hypothetical protein